MIRRYAFLRTALCVFFVVHFLREERFVLAILFLFFVCCLAEQRGSTSTSACAPNICSCKSVTPASEMTSYATQDVIVLDDDDDAPQVSMSQPQPKQGGGLTDEQRKRMAQQKELALARRQAKESVMNGVRLSTPARPRILETSDFRMWVPGDISECRRETEGQGHGQFMNGYQSPYSAGIGGGVKREFESRDDQNSGDMGWRSIRRRPVPGQSFGRDMNERPVKVEDDHGEAATNRWQHWKPEQRTENEQTTGTPSSPKETKPEAAKLDRAKAPQKPRALPCPSVQQMKVLSAIRNGKSVFLTGSAGTGKSFVLEYAIRLLRIVNGGEGVYVTASTGLAACALGGTTLHSFAGVGLGNGTKEAMVEKAKSRREVRNRWLFARALILDEISMIDGEFFDKLDYVGRIVRNKSQPFGGIQLIVTGDFYQLPPVNPPNPDKYFAFEADCWDKCFDLQIELKTVFRQTDEGFVEMLDEIRRGRCSPSIFQRLKNCPGPVNDDSGVVLTRLYPRKMDVSRENDQNLRALAQPTLVFTAKDEARNEFAKKQLDNVRVEAVLTLSLGAQVMLAKNLDSSVGLVNGARGVVVGFTSPDDPRCAELQKTVKSVSPSGMWPIVKFACDDLEKIMGPESWSITEGDLEVAKRTQVPLLLAWALSVHKCQGMTLDRVETDLSRAFDYGMVYVALSRVKTLDGLRLIGFDPAKIRVHPKVAVFYDKLGQAKNDDESVQTD